MRIIVDQLETNCKNCMMREINYSTQNPFCKVLNCRVKPDDEGNERPVVGIDKCHDNFITFKDIMRDYISGKFNEFAENKITDTEKESEEKKIDLVEDDGFLGKVKTNNEIINSTEEERKLVTIGEEIRSYKNKYYPETKSD